MSKIATIERWEPVAYDKSIKFRNGTYNAIIRMDADVWVFPRHSLLEAQNFLSCFPDDVCEVHNPPASVFYRRSIECETLVM